MSGQRIAITGFAVVLGFALACNHQSPAPTAPTTAAGQGSAADTPDGSTLKATAPVPTAPVSDAKVADTNPTLTASASTLKFSTPTPALQYRFQVFNDTGATVQDSGLVSAPSFTVTATLDANKRFTWRVRAEYQGALGPWSSTASFIAPDNPIVGYNRPGELYDPLTNGKTVSDAQVGRVTFVPGKGIRIADQESFVRYPLQQTLTEGEFSVDVEGLSDNPQSSRDTNTEKLKIFSMADTPASVYSSHYQCHVQYRGFNGNPDHSLSFKCLFGDSTDAHKLEPDLGQRTAGVQHLNPAATYMFKATWGRFFRMQVLDGGVGGVNGSGSAAGGRVIYDLTINTNGTYAPSPHFAYLGINDASQTGSWPGAIYRNVWVGSHARPTTLGSAARPGP